MEKQWEYDIWIVFHWQLDPFNNDQMMPCVVGVFDDEKLAAAACVDSDHYVFPMRLNEVISGAPVNHSDAYYPKRIAE